jgi:2-keto-4-pentenoate hydratase/2-oxohepta-3-ene-1,7-dioic acid hydratase in catechol pathway
MALWLRFAADGAEHFGTLEDDSVSAWHGDLFADPQPTGRNWPLAAVRVLPPCRPSKLIGLWNNFHERAAKEGLHRPEHPPYFIKGANCYAASGDTIRRPAGYAGTIVFEAELGIVIGRRTTAVSVAAAPAAIFGYTCVNDVTARDLMRLDPAFVHWTRAKSFDSFGPFGPAIATGLDPAQLRVRAVVNGIELQNYPVSDMFFSPAEIVSRLSHDMTLEPGDVIACGTSVGAGPLQAGDTVEVAIDGIGSLVNRFD